VSVISETRAGEARLNDAPSPPWRAEKFSGGYVVRDANGFAVAYACGRFFSRHYARGRRAREQNGPCI
jgi:hypothetical protein